MPVRCSRSTSSILPPVSDGPAAPRRATVKVSAQAEVKEVGVAGDLGYCWLKLAVTVTPPDDSPPMPHFGYAIVICRRQGAGAGAGRESRGVSGVAGPRDAVAVLRDRVDPDRFAVRVQTVSVPSGSRHTYKAALRFNISSPR
jgi:hypothetical protein